MARPSSGLTITAGYSDRELAWLAAPPRDFMRVSYEVTRFLGSYSYQQAAQVYWYQNHLGFQWDEVVGACDP